MSESEVQKLLADLQEAVGAQVVKQVNKAGNKRVAGMFALIILCTAWLTRLFGQAQDTLASISDLHRDAVRVGTLTRWVDETAVINPAWKPAAIRHNEKPLTP